MLYQFLPRLSDDEYTSLEKSIREHGIQVPIVVDENGSVIDGHHRKEIADRLGLPCPRNTARDLDETGKRTLACSLNLDRRHLNREQKREVIAKSLMADPQLSNRQHAERVGASHVTVGAIRQDMESTGQIDQSETRLSADGRERPATQPTPAVDYVTDQADLDAAPELPDEGAATPHDSGDAEPSEDEGLSVPSPSSRSVTGLDGKQYTRPEPKPAENKERPGSAMSATEADQDRQVQEARDLSRALLTLAAFQYPQARDRYRESWNSQPYARGNGEQFYNPTTIRLIAKSLTTFATELEEA